MQGFHHITAIAGDPRHNLHFWAQVLGQRLVKKTVNFDDPGTWHLYYADYGASPGTVITFFPWPKAFPGVPGSGEPIAVAYGVPLATLGDWESRLRLEGVDVGPIVERFGDPVLPLKDPDGMAVELVGVSDPADVEVWRDGPVPEDMALRGFHSTTLQVRDAAGSAVLLREEFGWSEVGREGNRTRYAVAGDLPGRVVDLLEIPDLPQGRMGAGSIHHVAFRTSDDITQQQWRAQLMGEGFAVTPMRDRQYFHSIYFNEPGGVLYEIATELPGFAWDETMQSLGSALRLPPWLEAERGRIEGLLPAL
jgi:glyoxalase family protein